VSGMTQQGTGTDNSQVSARVGGQNPSPAMEMEQSEGSQADDEAVVEARLVAVVRCTRPHGHTNQSHQTVLLECRAWSLLSWVMELLDKALKLLVLMWLVLLLLAITPSRASWMEQRSQRRGKAGANAAPGLSWSGGLPLQLSQLSALGLQADVLV
jgi:hypothetical protein